MNFVYVKNYLSVDKQQKMSFFKFLNLMDKFRIFKRFKHCSGKGLYRFFFKEKRKLEAMFVEQVVKKEDELIFKLKGFVLKKIKI